MEGGRPVGMNAHELQESAPEVRREDWIAIADDVLWQTVKPNDVLNAERRDICGHRFRGRDENCHFGETNHHHQNCIVVVTGWQVRYPV